MDIHNPGWWVAVLLFILSSLLRQWPPTTVLLPGKSHGRRSLVGCSPWGCEESDTTERLHCHFSLSCIGEGSGNPLQCSCLENPRDGGAWWAAVYGVAQSRKRLKRRSSSSSSLFNMLFYVYLFRYTTNIGSLKNYLKLQVRQKLKNENSHNLTVTNILGMYYSSVAA